MSKPSAAFFGWKNSPVAAEVEEILRANFDIKFSEHFSFGDTANQDEIAKLQVAFVFSFGPLILRKQLLDSASVGPINFHTAPPCWPGRGSCSYALLNNDKEFGVTAHIMNEKVDAGPILKVLRFAIEEDDDAETLHFKTLSSIPHLVRGLIDDLKANNMVPIPSGEQWERKALKQKELMPLMRINEEDREETVARKIRAFSHSQKPGPYIEKYGVKFWYLKSTS